MTEQLKHTCECGTLHELILPEGSRRITEECLQCGRRFTIYLDEAFQQAVDIYLA